MNILAINSGIGASVCLIQNGQIVLAVEEERLCREKGYMGFPLLSLRYLKERFPEIMGSLDAVGLAGTQDNLLSRTEFLQKYTERVRRDKDKSFRDLYLRPIRQNIGKLVPDRLKSSRRTFRNGSSVEELVLEELVPLGVDSARISRVNHHECHAAAAYLGLGNDPDRQYLVLTLDGGGDGECASVSIGTHGKLERLATTPSGHSIGNIYSDLAPSSRPYRGIGYIEYPLHDRTVTVTSCGRICMKGKKINFSTVFAGQNVGIKEINDSIWLVSFMEYDLGYFDEDSKRFEPLDNPFGAKVLPMSSE